jgi:protease I
MELEGRKIAIFVEQQFEDMELLYPYYRLKEAGAEVTLIGPEADKIYHSKHGYPIRSDRAADEVSPREFDALVIPGGYAPDHMRRNQPMVRFVADFAAQDKPLAVICHGLWMLCSADVLHNRRVTSFFSIKDDVIHAGANWVDEEVVEDGNFITSRHPGDLPAFLRTLIRALSAAHVTA